MKMAAFLSISVALALTPVALAADQPRLVLMDEGLSIQELRPLERHVYILTLEGDWSVPANPGAKLYVNVIYPNGAVASHRVLSEVYARMGEFRVVIQGADLIRNEVPRKANLTIVISQDRIVNSATAPEVISEPFVTPWPLFRPLVSCGNSGLVGGSLGFAAPWPLTRPMVKRAVYTRHTPRDPIDAMPLPDDAYIRYKPEKKRIKDDK